MDPRLRALNRFGLGARMGERDTLSDPRGWLRAQLEGGPPLLPAPEPATPAAIADALRAFRMSARSADEERRPLARNEERRPPSGNEERRPRNGDQERRPPSGEQDRRSARRRLVDIGTAEARAALLARATSDRPFVERLVTFWSNHLCVSAGAKVLVAPLAGSYERDAIRPYVLGKFEEMVLASAKHPAMLFYLDNFQSIGPSSQGVRSGGRPGARRGLNENYARELLELHTLGVNGGYTQQDVQELAKILTGWTVDGLGRPGAGAGQARPIGAAPGRPFGTAQDRRRARQMAQAAAARGPIRFAFQEALHETGMKTVLGTRYKGGVEEGEQAIRNLCRHPSTAQFIARKLAAHFIADDPPAAAVTRLARAFTESGGDLRIVARTLIDLPEAWAADTRKFRTPQEWLVAVLRAFRAQEIAENTTAALRQLRHPLWSPASPKGFGDAMQEWADPDALLNRAELARSIARRMGQRAVDPTALLTVVDGASGDPLRTLLADRSIAVGERVALAIAGPAFQWR